MEYIFIKTLERCIMNYSEIIKNDADKQVINDFKKDIKILLLADMGSGKGGAQEVVLRTRKLLIDKGFRVSTYCIVDAGVEINGATVFEIPKSSIVAKIKKFTFYPALYKHLRYFLKKENPDIVHLHMNSSFPLTVFSSLFGERVVYTLHGPYSVCPTGNYTVPPLWKECNRKANWLVIGIDVYRYGVFQC